MQLPLLMSASGLHHHTSVHDLERSLHDLVLSTSLLQVPLVCVEQWLNKLSL